MTNPTLKFLNKRSKQTNSGYTEQKKQSYIEGKWKTS